MSAQELTPYVRDSVQCNYCSEQAVFYCPYCKAQGKPVNVCYDHAEQSKKGLRCPVCFGKLYRISPRWIGSFSPMKKKNKNLQHKIWVEPKVHGHDERDNRIPRSEL